MQNHSFTHTRDTLLKDVDTLKNNVIQLANDVQENATAHVGQTKKQVNDTVRFAIDQVSARPYAILGVGVVLGLLLAFGARKAVV